MTREKRIRQRKTKCVEKSAVLAQFVQYLSTKNLIISGSIDKKMLRREYVTWSANKHCAVHIDEIGKQLLFQDFLKQPLNSASGQFEFNTNRNPTLFKRSFYSEQQRSHSLSSTTTSSSDLCVDFQNKVFIDKTTIKGSSKLINQESFVTHILSFTRQADPNFFLTSRGCLICRLNFSNEVLFQDHIKVHGEEEDNIIHKLNKLGESKIVKSQFKLTFEVKDNSPDVNFVLENISGKELSIERILLMNAGFIRLSCSILPITVRSDEKFCFDVDRQIFRDENHTYPIFINFWDSDEYIEQHNLVVKESFLQKTVTKAVPKFTRKTTLARYQMPSYLPSTEMNNLFHNKFEVFSSMTSRETSLLKEIRTICDNPSELNATNYTTNMSYMVEIEDLQVEKDMYDFDQNNVAFIPKNGFYHLEVKGLEEGRPSLMEYDKLWILPMAKSVEANKGRIDGYIYRIERDSLTIEFTKKKKRITIDETIRYRVHFMANRNNIQMQHHALDQINRNRLSKFFFPEKPNKLTVAVVEEEFDWFNNNIQSNPEQKQAVTNIVRGTSFPAPYILFGPPGTGKTMTIVETVCQLWKLKPKSNILISTASNSACNEIASRLLKHIPDTDIFRLFAGSQEKKRDQIDDELIEVSNLESGDHFYPCLEELYQFRIILCTLCVAGKLGLAKISPTHFSHVFIDECGSASEPEALIPIVGIITGRNRMLGSIVLAGDPKQLGPILASEKASQMGMGLSLLERLMDHEIYKKDPVTNVYNTDLITKLIRNFRSHEMILKLPSDMFYDGDLLAMGFKENTDWALNWKYLPNKKCPIVFKSVKGVASRDQNSPSWYNKKEVVYVMSYIMEILKHGINKRRISPTDIGVITPYRKQCSKILNELDKNRIKDIQVGSVEQFQGQEKPIIILSTVRSNMKTVGFLDNPKRMNVSLTRSKSLLIVVGDDTMLSKDRNWKQFIDYCVENGAVVKPTFHRR